MTITIDSDQGRQDNVLRGLFLGQHPGLRSGGLLRWRGL
uniref:Uncharacterized protein n=1 Tax=Pseudomonas phage PACT201 TaxID=3230130 RepID=A0AAU8GW24_9VIRU